MLTCQNIYSYIRMLLVLFRKGYYGLSSEPGDKYKIVQCFSLSVQKKDWYRKNTDTNYRY